MDNEICKCGHLKSKHVPDESVPGALMCIGEGSGESLYCECMNFEDDDLKKIEANYDALQSPMPCGHLARYAVNEEEGTQYCCMCHVSNLDGTIDVLHKTLREIATGLDEAEGCTCEMGEAPGGEQYHAISCSETLAIIARRAIGE